MKNLTKISIVLVLVSLISCKKFLDVQPKDAVSDQINIVDKGSAETALNGAYRALAGTDYYGQKFQFVNYLRGGDLGWGDSRTVNREFIQNNVRADNEEVNNVWVAIYKTINLTNHLISKVPTVNDITFTAADKDKILGEAYFIRAISYFDLVRTWGGVPLIVKPSVNADDTKGITRSSVFNVYDFIEKDLEKAELLLGATTNRVRATKKTVWALKARLHLYKGEWPQAESYATQVIDDAANYSLVKPFGNWFQNNAVGSRESILETAYSSVVTNTHRNSWLPPERGGIRSWFPVDSFVTPMNDPAIGGSRKVLIAKATTNLWYGQLYYRAPATDPSYVIRLAEVYLIRAEARAEQDNYTGAADDINAVRDRADLTAITISTKEEAILAIEQEIRFEFFAEPHRFFYLVRKELLDDKLNITDVNKYLLPIPNPQIVVDNSLTQNPGY
jgi:hypothetical protein